MNISNKSYQCRNTDYWTDDNNVLYTYQHSDNIPNYLSYCTDPWRATHWDRLLYMPGTVRRLVTDYMWTLVYMAHTQCQNSKNWKLKYPDISFSKNKLSFHFSAVSWWNPTTNHIPRLQTTKPNPSHILTDIWVSHVMYDILSIFYRLRVKDINLFCFNIRKIVSTVQTSTIL